MSTSHRDELTLGSSELDRLDSTPIPQNRVALETLAEKMAASYPLYVLYDCRARNSFRRFSKVWDIAKGALVHIVFFVCLFVCLF